MIYRVSTVRPDLEYRWGDVVGRNLCDIARKIVALSYDGGIEDGPLVCVGRNGKDVFQYRSIYWAAAHVLKETDNGFVWVRYKPFPGIDT